METQVYSPAKADAAAWVVAVYNVYLNERTRWKIWKKCTGSSAIDENLKTLRAKLLRAIADGGFRNVSEAVAYNREFKSRRKMDKS